ncbi:hypothetical protein [Photobacterium kishitanii]|uniref:Flagellar motor switch protein FliN-like C-terminal domain-containing protein n=1 Tax=Photobacterium kishitanii TaxID=318456 RepID=A0A2T3KMT0_9GAMM|nr:hypothetical protein [Photobacterium kishitanii]PSV01106.1 hypothetical protein C9J27_03545 [Photobacterium kishitanii]
MFIDKKSKSELELLQAESLARHLKSDLANTISQVLRKVLGKPFTRTVPDVVTIKKITNSEYIKTAEPKLSYKLGYVFNKTDFSFVGFPRKFISQCAYFYAGGKNEFIYDSSLDATKLNLTEESFFSDFTKILSKEIERIFLSGDQFEDLELVDFIGADMQLSSSCGIFEDELLFECDGATLHVPLFATKDILKKINSASMSDESNVTLASIAKNKAMVSLISSFKVDGLDVLDIMKLKIGDTFPVRLLDDGSPETYLHTVDNAIQVSGTVGCGSMNQYVFKCN